MIATIIKFWPWLMFAYKTIKSLLALFGAIVIYIAMFYYGVATEVLRDGLVTASFIIVFCLEGGLLVVTFQLYLKNLSQSRYREPIIEGSGEFDIKDSGNVIYDSGTTLAELKKSKFTADTWKSLAKKYQGKDYRGKGWELVRLHCLTQAKKAPSFEINGNQVTF